MGIAVNILCVKHKSHDRIANLKTTRTNYVVSSRFELLCDELRCESGLMLGCSDDFMTCEEAICTMHTLGIRH